ncbi:hypothetical protein RAA17_16385 [Komagataeibacter rhaeticus]|nr:hypothetical protein [Komagataeibacter rhaeticus]
MMLHETDMNSGMMKGKRPRLPILYNKSLLIGFGALSVAGPDMTRAHRNPDFPAGGDAALWQQLCGQPAADDPVTQMLVASGLPVMHGIILPFGADEGVEIDHIFASADGLHTLHAKHYIAWINAPSSEKETRSQGGAGNFAYNNDFLQSFLKLAEAVSTTINDPLPTQDGTPVPVTGHFLLPYKVPLMAPCRIMPFFSRNWKAC